MKKILLIIILLASSNLYSQDTVNAKFFPMHVGNYYVYKQTFFMVSGFTYKTARILRDTLIEGKRYFRASGFPILNTGENISAWIRYDSLRSNIIIRSDSGCTYPKDRIYDSLKSSPGDIIECANNGQTICQTSNDTLFSSIHDGFVYQIIYYGKDIGILGGCGGEPPPCEVYYSFHGAVINGVVYGDTTLTNIEQIGNSTPESFNLYQNYPNPFNPSTNIKFDIPRRGNVKIIIYDISGKLVAELLNQNLSPGSYITSWNAVGFASGIYYYRIISDSFSETKKMILVR